MVQILRLYPIVEGQEICVREPKEIAKILSNPGEDIDLDYGRAGRVKMGSSREFIGHKVLIGEDLELEIPEH